MENKGAKKNSEAGVGSTLSVSGTWYLNFHL